MIDTFANRLRTIMNEENLRQIDIIKLTQKYKDEFKVKIGKTDLSQYVSGKLKPGNEKLSLLSKALNVSEAWLLGFNVAKDRPNNTVESKTSSEHIPLIPLLKVKGGKNSKKLRNDKLVINVDEVRINSKIAKRLKYLRKARKISASRLISDLKLNSSNYLLAEEGRLTLLQDDLIKIADYYDVSVDWILGRSNIMNSDAGIDKMIDHYFDDLLKSKIIKYPDKIDEEVVRTIMDFFFEGKNVDIEFKKYLDDKSKN